MSKNNKTGGDDMRKFRIVMLIVMLSVLVFTGCKKDNAENTQLDTIIEVSSNAEEQITDDVQATETPNETTAPEGDGGGNEFINEGETVEVMTIAILVSNDEYFFENAPITLEEIVSMLEGIEGGLVVEITDNNATYKAYDKLVDKLIDLEITYIEE